MSVLNMSRAVRRLSQTAKVKVIRQSAGEFVDGRYIRQEPTEFEILASVQPAEGRTLLQLPEAQRTREVIEIYSVDRLLVGTASGLPGDIVEFEGRRFQVTLAEDWDGLGKYFRSVAVRSDKT
jgi:hypothetical protein